MRSALGEAAKLLRCGSHLVMHDVLTFAPSHLRTCLTSPLALDFLQGRGRAAAASGARGSPRAACRWPTLERRGPRQGPAGCAGSRGGVAPPARLPDMEQGQPNGSNPWPRRQIHRLNTLAAHLTSRCCHGAACWPPFLLACCCRWPPSNALPPPPPPPPQKAWPPALPPL